MLSKPLYLKQFIINKHRINLRAYKTIERLQLWVMLYATLSSSDFSLKTPIFAMYILYDLELHRNIIRLMKTRGTTCRQWTSSLTLLYK